MDSAKFWRTNPKDSQPTVSRVFWNSLDLDASLSSSSFLLCSSSPVLPKPDLKIQLDKVINKGCYYKRTELAEDLRKKEKTNGSRRDWKRNEPKSKARQLKTRRKSETDE